MKSLYRRYRPVRLEEVVGQPQVTEPLLKSLEAGKVGHAYLFTGPRGCGKTSVARILAHKINGFDYEIEDEYVDIIEIDAASNRGIDNIRELREKAAIAPSVGKYKVYIIDEVHMLTKEAFNALLKTLEEPPEHVVFIMATTDAHKVPVTITSRAQIFGFKLAESKVMLKFLGDVAKKEKIKISEDALGVIVRRGGGSFRDTLSLLDQISTLSNDKITLEMVTRAMGLPEEEMIAHLLEEYVSGDMIRISEALRDSLLAGVKPETLVSEMIGAIVNEPRAEWLSLLARLSEVKEPYVEAKLLVALCGVQPMAMPARVVRAATPSPTVEPKVDDMKRPGSSKPSKLKAPGAETNDFDWTSYTCKVQELNDGVYSQLIKCDHEYQNGELLLYPPRKFVHTLLSRDNNKAILVQAADGVKITIADVGSTSNDKPVDETLSKISAIMGGEVKNDGGKSPF